MRHSTPFYTNYSLTCVHVWCSLHEPNSLSLPYTPPAPTTQVKIKKLETSASEFVKIEEDLKKQIEDLKDQQPLSVPPLAAVSSEARDSDALISALQNQLDEKSREIFVMKKKLQTDTEDLNKALVEKDQTIARLNDLASLLQEEINRLRSGNGTATEISGNVSDESLQKKDEEIALHKSKIQKYNSMLKAKMKELEAKEVEITLLRANGSLGAGRSVPTDSATSSTTMSVLIKRIECNGLKNVEVGGALSGMLGGAFGGAFGDALGAAVGGTGPVTT